MLLVYVRGVTYKLAWLLSCKCEEMYYYSPVMKLSSQNRKKGIEWDLCAFLFSLLRHEKRSSVLAILLPLHISVKGWRGRVYGCELRAISLT